MRKVLFLLMAALVLVACDSNEKENEVASVEQNDKEVDDANDEDSKDDLGTDEILLEVGQKTKDSQSGAIIELMKIKEINETIDLDPIELHIESIKVLKQTGTKDKSFKEYISQFTDKEDFEYIQIRYTVENTVEENIELSYPIRYIVLDTGEQIDVAELDFALDSDNGGEFFGKVIKDTGIATIIKDSESENINKIKLIFGTVYDENYDVRSEKVEIEYEL